VKDGHELVFRPAGRRDFSEVRLLPEDRREAFWVFPAHNYPIQVSELARNMKSRRDVTVAEYAGAVVGFANLYHVAQGRSCFVGNLSVSSRLRRRGVARRLLGAMAGKARSGYGVQDIHVSCFSDNLKGLLFYQQLGFEPYGMQPQMDWDLEPALLIHLRRGVRALELMGQI
jgi:ribosomal protein S18 acetylase RimI-like enzyme